MQVGITRTEITHSHATEEGHFLLDVKVTVEIRGVLGNVTLEVPLEGQPGLDHASTNAYQAIHRWAEQLAKATQQHPYAPVG